VRLSCSNIPLSIAVCNDIDPSPYWVFNIAALETFTFSVHPRRPPSDEWVNCTDYRCRARRMCSCAAVRTSVSSSTGRNAEKKEPSARLDNDDGPRGLHDASRLPQGSVHGDLRNVVEKVQENSVVKRTILERHHFRAGRPKLPTGNRPARDRQGFLFGSTPVTLAPRADNEPARTPLPQPTSRIRFLARGANAATMMDRASFSGGNSPSRIFSYHARPPRARRPC
jgi:hypothetical protein